MGKIEQILGCIKKAENKESKLTEQCFSIGGYTSNKIRCLLNNLGSISENYLEIGVHRGATFISAVYGNEKLRMRTGVDNWSEFNEDNTVKNDFINNASFLLDKYSVIEKDCFEIKPNQLEREPDLYFYDGNHSEEAQKKALTYFYPMLPNEFIFCCDDYQWEAVKKGTQYGIKECGVEVLFDVELGMQKESDGEEYWNGFYVALLKKKA